MKFKESLNLLSDMSDSQRYPLNFLHFKLLLAIYIKIVYLYLKFFIKVTYAFVQLEKKMEIARIQHWDKNDAYLPYFCSDNGLKGTVGHARYMEDHWNFVNSPFKEEKSPTYVFLHRINYPAQCMEFDTTIFDLQLHYSNFNLQDSQTFK